MKRIADIAGTIGAILASTILLSRWWYWHPTYFPSLPASLWKLMDRFVGPERADAIHDAELIVVIATAFVVCAVCVSAMRFFAIRLWRRRAPEANG